MNTLARFLFGSGKRALITLGTIAVVVLSYPGMVDIKLTVSENYATETDSHANQLSGKCYSTDTKMRIALAWVAQDGNLQKKTDAGAWQTVFRKDQVFHYSDKNVQAGHSYSYRIKRGNTFSNIITISPTPDTCAFATAALITNLTNASHTNPYYAGERIRLTVAGIPNRPVQFCSRFTPADATTARPETCDMAPPSARTAWDGVDGTWSMAYRLTPEHVGLWTQWIMVGGRKSNELTYQVAARPALWSVQKQALNQTKQGGWQDTMVAADPGDTITFSVSINNMENLWPLVSARFTDQLPRRLIFVPGSAAINGEAALDAVITDGYTFSSISTGSAQTITFKARVAGENSFERETIVRNKAVVRVRYEAPQSDEVGVNVSMPAAPLSLVLTTRDGITGCTSAQPIRLAWEPSWQTASSSERFTVKRTAETGGSYTTLATTNSLSYDDRPEAGRYFYLVSAEIPGIDQPVSSGRVPARMRDCTPREPAVTVRTPNGGERYVAGSSMEISWRRNWMPQGARGLVDIALYYPVGNAEHRMVIAEGIQDGSPYRWNIPSNLEGTSFKVGVSSRGTSSNPDELLSDMSNAAFSIVRPQYGQIGGSVRLLPNNPPRAFEGVKAVAMRAGKRYRQALSADGRFTFAQLPIGTYEMTLDPCTWYACRYPSVATKVVTLHTDGQQETVEFIIDTGN